VNKIILISLSVRVVWISAVMPPPTPGYILASVPVSPLLGMHAIQNAYTSNTHTGTHKCVCLPRTTQPFSSRNTQIHKPSLSHTDTHIYTHTFTHELGTSPTHTHTHKSVYVCAQANRQLVALQCVCMCVHVCVCVCVSACV